jgi:hypothetical protein
MVRRHTLLLFLALCVRSPVHAGLQDLILTLELVLKLILELTHLVGRGTSDRALASLEGGGLVVRGVGTSFRHFIGIVQSSG